MSGNACGDGPPEPAGRVDGGGAETGAGSAGRTGCSGSRAKNRSVQAAEIPLYLLPKVISRLIRLKGDAVYRISVVRTHWHHYNVRVRTKRILRELVPQRTLTCSGIPDTLIVRRKSGRRCAA